MTPKYKLITQAADGGGRWCSAEVHLTVTDVNDNPPTFTMSQYTTSVYEDTSIKALLTRIQAIDPDEGDEMNTAHNKITHYCCWSFTVKTVKSVALPLQR